MTTPDIPEDIRAIAEELGFAFAVAALEEPAIEEIALALLRAREEAFEEAAKIAEHRVQLAPTLAPKAAGAIFVALPDAIRAASIRGTE